MDSKYGNKQQKGHEWAVDSQDSAKNGEKFNNT